MFISIVIVFGHTDRRTRRLWCKVWTSVSGICSRTDRQTYTPTAILRPLPECDNSDYHHHKELGHRPEVVYFNSYCFGHINRRTRTCRTNCSTCTTNNRLINLLTAVKVHSYRHQLSSRLLLEAGSRKFRDWPEAETTQYIASPDATTLPFSTPALSPTAYPSSTHPLLYRAFGQNLT